MLEELHVEAYNEGAFYADTDWQWVRKDEEGPSSMAQHCAVSWAFIAGTVCPEWDNERMRLSFFIGYEDRATELADAGEAGYEALAEAGSVAETEGWVVQSEPWSENASDQEKAMRAVWAAMEGAAARLAKFDWTGNESDRHAAGEAKIRAASMTESQLSSRTYAEDAQARRAIQ
ncbi:hypothetical protein [Paraburkholderia fungorum]|uniref:hypothetical protein n=1 Tax=Paraburkholderia fungorum TaxID=134537 RepID=UPI001622606F|nr:hypothetical protein [Paraburkholderia fungorum]